MINAKSSYLLLVLLAIGLTSRGAGTAPGILFLIDTSSTTQSGKPVVKNFYFHDISLRGHPVHFMSDSFYLEAQQPVLLLQADGRQTPYLVYPGETIQISFLESGQAQMTVAGNEQRTSELNFFQQLVQQTGNLSYAFKLPPYIRQTKSMTELAEYAATISATRQKRLSLLDQGIASKTLSSAFAAIAINNINSAALHDTLQLYVLNKDLLQKQGLYKSKIEEITSSLQLIRLTAFKYPLQCIADLTNVVAAGTIHYTKYGLPQFEQQYRAIDAAFTGAYREYAQFKVICDAARNYVEIPRQYLDNFYATSTDSSYRLMIEASLKEAASLSTTAEDALIDGDALPSTLAAVLKKHQGSIVLLDFWASWCAPCRAEMKHGRKLLRKLEGKPFTIVYLSIDENRAAWQKAMRQEELSSGSYLLLVPYRAKILQANDVIGIPRYMLIGKNGNMISYDAPRPSDERLLKLIEKNL